MMVTKSVTAKKYQFLLKGTRVQQKLSYQMKTHLYSHPHMRENQLGLHNHDVVSY